MAISVNVHSWSRVHYMETESKSTRWINVQFDDDEASECTLFVHAHAQLDALQAAIDKARASLPSA